MNEKTKLNHAIEVRWLLLFALPTIASSIFANLYSTVDGVFVARWVNTDALSAINITMPMTYLGGGLCVHRCAGSSVLSFP